LQHSGKLNVVLRISPQSLVRASKTMPTVDKSCRIYRKLHLFRHFETGAPFFLSLVLGCGSTDGLNRQAMSGRVTVDGQPLTSGAILFEPETEQSGTVVGATIRQGAFVISRYQGAVPGTYRVRVYASSRTQAPLAKGQTERTPRPMVERLPARYNTHSELHAAVRARRHNQYTFDLISSEFPDAQ
jgi:hypothetical protein